MNNLLWVALLVVVVFVAGCTAGPFVEGSGSVNESEVEGAFTDFEDTLLDEGDDVEIGSLI